MRGWIGATSLVDDPQTANTVLAGPTTGAAATPTCRALVADDIPGTLNATTVTGSLTVGAGSGAGANVNVNGTYGAEKVTTNATFDANLTDWTAGAAWRWANGAAEKFQDGTTTLSRNLSAVVGERYKIVLVTKDAGAGYTGTLTVAIGGVSESSVTLATAPETITIYIMARTTGNFSITPSNSSRFGIDSVSVKKITDGTLTTEASLTTTGGRVIVRPWGNIAYPALTIGADGNGLIQSASGLGLVTAAALRASFGSSTLYSNTSGGFEVLYGAASETTPGFRFVDDSDTGLGHPGTDQVDLIAGGTQVLTATPTGTTTTLPITGQRDNIGTTVTDEFNLTNTTASTVGATLQYSPAIRYEAHAWQTATNADDKWEWRSFVVPYSAATSLSYWNLTVSKNGGAPSQIFTLSNSGGGQFQSGTSSNQFFRAASMYSDQSTPANYTGLGQNAAYSATPAASDVVVIDTTTANRQRRALTTDASAVVAGVFNSYSFTATTGAILVNVTGAVAIGDQLVVSTVANGCAMKDPSGTPDTTARRAIVGWAESNNSTAKVDNAAYVSHDPATEIVTVNSTAETWAANQRIVLMGGTFGGLTQGAAYYVINPTGSPTTAFQLSLTSGGVAINLDATAATGSPVFEPTSTVSVWMR